MIDYRSHRIEDLATDEMFRRWVIAPTPEISNFWQLWLHENPDRAETVRRAKELVLAVGELYQDELTDEVVAQETAEIARLAALKTGKTYRHYWPTIWKAAAAILLVAGLGWLYYVSKTEVNAEEEKIARHEQSEQIETRTNQSDREITVLLSDNSVATLSKGSSISFPRAFEAGERRVHLKGEAFFDVAKNPAQPFLVFTNETVTKVLGTSFRVKAFDHDNTVLVAVKTGRVSVFPKEEYEKATAHAQRAGVVLAPNQQAVFLRKEHRLEKSAVARPDILAESAVQKPQMFDDKPVTEVFRSLENLYGIQVEFNAETLGSCRINAQFDDENLKQRLNAICEAIGANYDIVGGQVVVTSRGCL